MDYITRMLSNPPQDVHCPIMVDADRPGRTLSWQEYSVSVKRVAVGLREAGVADRDGVGLLSPNDIYFHVFGDGAIAAGAVFVPVPGFVKEADLANCITSGDVKWLFASPELIELALATAETLAMDKSRILVFDPPGLDPYNGPKLSFSRLMEADETVWRNPYNGQDPRTLTAIRLFTSGTTGKNKAAETSHATQVARLDSDHALLPLGSKVLQITGIYHVSGQTVCNRACAGMLTAYVSRVDNDPATILDKIQVYGIDAVLFPTVSIKKLTAAILDGVRPRDTLQSLRYVTFGGSFCGTPVLEALKDLLPREAHLRPVYGSTESWFASIAQDWTPGYVGSPMEDVQVKVIDPETLEPLVPGIEGEICLRSAYVFDGYCKNPEASKSAFLPGESWFRTGDKGSLDVRNGQIALTGRYKEIFKVNSVQVSPSEVAEQLMLHPGIADAVACSTPARDDDDAVECMAYVVRSKDLTAQEVVDYIATKLNRHKSPTGAVVFCEHITRGAAGKPVRDHLVAQTPLPGSARYLTVSASHN
ncbi:AMP-dependent synthetase/ligase [Metarhizium guizhouense ARSEF 977]|uniref:AMP-dependent synthetase/ligase n=1 Tax=Metarhizium guizhouense (strain ARSEF 977) TaxID=1276136 RepID=A0A0B4HRA1_METGA|nr:AMP-dependent synthetase/ligase [Metarhizium guizhouense ARSEF 977]